MIKDPSITDDQVFIENIPRLEWGKNTENSFVRSAQVTLNTLGESYSYPFIMGISGAAFRFHFQPDWCPSAADATTGFDVSKILFKSLGYDAELIKINDSNLSEIQHLYIKIIEHINQGIPVIANNLKVCPEWGIISGYLKTKPGLICRTYFDNGDDYSLAEHAPWLSFFVGGQKKDPLETKTLFFNSLKIAVQLAKTDYFGEYASGFKAYQVWKDHISQFIQSNKKFTQYRVNLSLIHHLIDAKIAAVSYLTEMINSFPINHGLEIVNNFIKELKILQELHTNVLPDFYADEISWTSDILEQQIHVLDQVLVLETNTVELIEEALANGQINVE